MTGPESNPGGVGYFERSIAAAVARREFIREQIAEWQALEQSLDEQISHFGQQRARLAQSAASPATSSYVETACIATVARVFKYTNIP